MYKSNKRSQLLLTIFIAVGLLGAASGQIQKCALVGEYCQYHWDCCSNSCMTYLYKCMRNNKVFSYTFLANEHPSKTSEEILEMNFVVNNFVKSSAVPHPIGDDSFLGANEVSPNDSRMTVNDNVPFTTASYINRLSTTQSPFSTITKPITASASSTITLSITTTAPPTKCSEIGEKCYRNEECCTKRCHFYLHQCVT